MWLNSRWTLFIAAIATILITLFGKWPDTPSGGGRTEPFPHDGSREDGVSRRSPSPAPHQRLKASPSVAVLAPSASPSRTPAPAPPPWLHAVYVRLVNGPDCITWTAEFDLPSHRGEPRVCIDPPPFGQQCTMHARDALLSCVRQARCHALTCPDQAPYAPLKSAPDHRGIGGEICQARSVPAAIDWLPPPVGQGLQLSANHGMCSPSGCLSLFLTRMGRNDVDVRARARLDELARNAGAGDKGKANPVLVFVPDTQPGLSDNWLQSQYDMLSLGGPAAPLLGTLEAHAVGIQSSPMWLLADGSVRDRFLAPASGSVLDALDRHAWLGMPGRVRVYMGQCWAVDSIA